MAELRRRRSVSQGVSARPALGVARQLANRRCRSCDVIDIGGGTGGIATSLLRSANQVTVIDSKPGRARLAEAANGSTKVYGQHPPACRVMPAI